MQTNRICFLNHEPNEPSPVHVVRENLSFKFWLNPVSLVRNLGFNVRELRKIQSVLAENDEQLLEAWYEYFGH